MSTITDGTPTARERRSWTEHVLVREMWASLAISVMWLAVLFAAIFAPDIISTTNTGNATRIPSGVAVALFAAIGTRGVAKYGFTRRGGDKESGTDG